MSISTITKYEALHTLFNSFSLNAYPANSVPKSVTLPYMTYELRIGRSAEITLHVYHYTKSEKIPNDKAEEICEYFRYGGRQVAYTGGTLWVTTSNPEWYASADEADQKLKHRFINLTLQDTGI